MARGGGNAIASAAVTLTASADGLATGLDQAKARLDKFGSDTGKVLGVLGKYSRKGQGLLGDMLLGAAGGGAAGVGLGFALQGLDKARQALTGDAARGLNDRVKEQGGFDRGPLDDVVKQFDRVWAAADKSMVGFLRAASPAIERFADLLVKGFEVAAPLVEKVGRGIGAYGYIVAELADQLSGVVLAVAQWGAEFLGLDKITVSVEDVVFGFFKMAAQGAGYLWDTLKAGAGVFATVGSFIVDGLGELVDAFKETIRDLLNLAGKLPDELGGEWFRGQAAQVDQLGSKLAGIAADMRGWGVSMFGAWGQTAAQAGAWFDQLRKKFDNRPALQEATAAPRFAGAVEMGSREAYSIDAAARYGGKESPAEIQKRTNQLLEELNKNTIDVQKEIERLQLAWEVL